MPDVVLSLQPPTRLQVQVWSPFFLNNMLTSLIDIVHLISCVSGSCRILRNKLQIRFSAFSALSFWISYSFGNMVSRSQQNPILKVILPILLPLLITDNLYSGWLICVALVVVVCDKPAAHKIGGFASHSHTNFCTECWISIEDKHRLVVFQQNGKSFLVNLNLVCTIGLITHQDSSQGLINNSVHLVTSIMHSPTPQCTRTLLESTQLITHNSLVFHTLTSFSKSSSTPCTTSSLALSRPISIISGYKTKFYNLIMNSPSGMSYWLMCVPSILILFHLSPLMFHSSLSWYHVGNYPLTLVFHPVVHWQQTSGSFLQWLWSYCCESLLSSHVTHLSPLWV